MKNSIALMKSAGILPKLRLGNKTAKGVVRTGSHKVKMLEDKIIKGSDPQTGKEIELVRYILEENGEKKYYDTKLRDKGGGLSYLVQRLSEVAEGEEVMLEMKKRGVKNYVEVTKLNDREAVEVEDHDEEVGDIISLEE